MRVVLKYLLGKVLSKIKNVKPIFTIESKLTPLALIPKVKSLSVAELKGVPKVDRNNKVKELKDRFNNLLLYLGLEPVEFLNKEQTEGVYDLLKQLKFRGVLPLIRQGDNILDYLWSKNYNISLAIDKFFNGKVGWEAGLLYKDDDSGVFTYLISTKDGKNLIPAKVSHEDAGKLGNAELSFGLNLRTRTGNFILTAPRANALEFNLSPELILIYPDKTPKSLTRPFFIASQKAMTPGSYTTGDANGEPLGMMLLDAYNKGDYNLLRNLVVIPTSASISVRGAGLSTDSYGSILRLGMRPGLLLRYSSGDTGFVKWNNLSLNKEVYDASKRALTEGTEEAKQNAVEVFNSWAFKLNPNYHPAYIDKDGYVRYPHPWLFKDKMKKGGKL